MFPHGHFLIFPTLFFVGHVIVVGGAFYFLYCISKSLRRIADALEKESPAAEKEVE